MSNQMPLPISIEEEASDTAAFVTRPEWRSGEVKAFPPDTNIPLVMGLDEPVFVSNNAVLPAPYRPSQEDINKNTPYVESPE